jgi:hypothetical protein
VFGRSAWPITVSGAVDRRYNDFEPIGPVVRPPRSEIMIA